MKFTCKHLKTTLRSAFALVLTFALLLGNTPFGIIELAIDSWQDRNVVDLLWQSERDNRVVDSFGPRNAHAAQVTIESDTTDTTEEFGPSPTVVFTTDQTGYLFFIDAGNDLVYRKTVNGGTNWATPVVVDNAITGWTAVSVWYDQWTPGDTTGTKIHIAAADDSGGDAYYTFLDTNGDGLKGSVVQVINQTTFTGAANAAPSITKGAGGALFLSANFASTAGGYVYKSTDGAGNTWTNATPSGWSSASLDQIQLLPLLTDNDIIAIRADTANNDIDYRIYDEVADSWDGSWSSSITSLTENATYDQWFSASIRKSTGDVYLAINNNTNNSANDIEFWSFDDSSRGSGFVQGGNVYTNSSQILSPTTMVDEETGDIYVVYIGGSIYDYVYQGGALDSITYVYYKKSTDGGASWGSARGVISDYPGDDYKYIRGNLLSSDRLYVAFYDDDDNDIFGTSIMGNNVLVEGTIDSAIVDATDEYGPSPSGVFVDEDTGYQFFAHTNLMLDGTDEFAPSPSTVFTDANIGYIFFIDSPSQDLVYRKTTDGGVTWSGSRVIDTTKTGWTTVSVWYDQWTPGDTTGTKIHIAASDDASDDVFYTFLDTANDTLKGSMVTAVSGSATLTEAADGPPTITKGGSGYLFIAANFTSTAGGKVSKSTDGAGSSWSDVTPSGWSTVAIDQIQLVPLSTDNDIIAIRADTANNDIDSRVYDEVGDTWDGSWTSIASLTENTTYDQWFSATIDKSTGDVYLTFTNAPSVATGDIEFWKYTDSGRAWAKSASDVYSNTATILAPVPFYETDTGTIYVAYARGTLANTMHVYYKSTTDGGANWSSESSALSTTGDDFKTIRGNMMHDGNLYVVWHNDDTNYIKGDNILSPASYDLPVTSAQSIVYSKTVNGGGAWGPPYSVASVDGATAVAVWYDQWTPGDTTGTKIHIAFSDDQTDDYYYTYLDTASDTVGTTTKVLLGTSITEAGVGVPGITRGASGNLFLSGNFNTTAGGTVAKSTNGGASWSDVTPSAWSTVAIDQIQLLPLLTDNDIIAIRADTGNNGVDYRIYDEVGDTWDGAWSSNITSLTENTTYDQWFSASIKKSTGDVYLTLANNTANAANDIEFWSLDDSNRGSGFIQGGNVYTDSNTVMMPMVMVDEGNGDLYVSYLRGTFASAVDVFFKKSMDGGDTWSGESASLSPGIYDDVMGLRGTLLGSDRLYAFWYNDDLNDIYGNTVTDTWQLAQSAYRFFANTDSTDVGSALAAQDTAATLSSTGEAFRLRMLIHASGEMPTLGSNLKLQFAEKSGTCDADFSGESYADVTGASVIAFNNNATPSDGDNLTANINDPMHSGHTVVNQDYEESNNFTTTVSSIPSGQDGKWDFSLIDNGATAETSYCFRVVESDGTVLDSYGVVPEITTASGAPIYSISITSSGVIEYGFVEIGTASTTLTGFTQTAQNDGNVTEKLNVKSSNATGGTGWTLASSIGSDQFTHEFSTTTGAVWTNMPNSNTYVTADPSVAASDTVDFDFRITVPSATTDYQEKSFTITVQAVAP